MTEGLYLKAYKVQADDSVLNYGRHVVRTYPGKAAVNPSSTAPNGAGMLVTIESGGMMIVGSGESAKNLADLISDDQSDANTSRTRLNVGGTLNTAFSGDTESLILSSDGSIYFLTNCNTIADRTPVVLSTGSSFYPGTTGTGSIGTSSYRWNTAYINTIYENGTSLANKYQAKLTNPVTGSAAWTAADRILVTNAASGNVIKQSSYTIATSVPANAVFTDTTYAAGTGLSLSGTTFNHSNSVTAKTDYNKKFFTHDVQGHITDISWYIHKASGTNGSNSDSTWIKIATLVHTSTYNNSPITITFTQRGNTTRNRLTIRFSSADTKILS